MKTGRPSLVAGKYRDLLLTIGLFVVLDLGILLFNFFASAQLERDAARINAAGELRMLTQQLTKSVLTLQAESKADLPTQTSLAQISQGYAGFNKSLASIEASMGSEWEFRIFGLDRDVLQAATTRVAREWRPLGEALAPLSAGLVPQAEDIDIAVNKAVARNLKLMSLCDDLAQAIEGTARSKANRMRQIQVLAIVLALANFVYIVFKFLRRLNASDDKAERARRETDDILATVSEGLLLVHADGTLGGQFSASVPRLFMRDVKPGDDFAALLDDLLEAGRGAEARHFIRLLFDPKVKPALLGQVDPLRVVQLRQPDASTGKPRFLSFQVNQVRAGGLVKELLVTVFDITEKVLLERELAATQQAAKGDVEDLIRVLEQEPALLQDFLLGARDKLATLNQELRDARSEAAYAQAVQGAATLVHGIKGEAAAIGLSSLSRQAHVMEDVLAPLRGRSDLSGSDLIAVALALSRVQEQVDRLWRVFDRVGAGSRVEGDSSARRITGMVDNLHALSRRVAESLAKEVRLTATIGEAEVPAAVAQVLREALPQLVRNAVVHGIEPPRERVGQGKPAAGELRLEIARTPDGGFEVSLQDDGRGIEVPVLRERALQLRDDASRLTDAQLLGLIFDPAFTTATEVTEHAGRGEGLALVRQVVERAGAKLRVMTQPRSYTRFVLQFGAAA